MSESNPKPGLKDLSSGSVIKNSLRRLSQSFVLMHKTQIKIWKAMLITVFVAGFSSALILAVSQDWFAKIFGAPTVITNQAQVTYQDASGNTYSGESNPVTTTVVAAATPKIMIKIEPEGKTTNFSSTITLYIYQAGTSNLVLQASNTTSTTGELEINAASLANTAYDLRVVCPYYLSQTLKNITFSGADLDLRGQVFRPKAGNLQNADNVINALDWAIMSENWGGAAATADINGDGMVNTLDWGIMNNNWLAQGS